VGDACFPAACNRDCGTRKSESHEALKAGSFESGINDMFLLMQGGFWTNNKLASLGYEVMLFKVVGSSHGLTISGQFPPSWNQKEKLSHFASTKTTRLSASWSYLRIDSIC
jgi:hypothetical protein